MVFIFFFLFTAFVYNIIYIYLNNQVFKRYSDDVILISGSPTVDFNNILLLIVNIVLYLS